MNENNGIKTPPTNPQIPPDQSNQPPAQPAQVQPEQPQPAQTQPVLSQPTPSMSIWRIFQSIVIVAFITATIFTMWTPSNLFSNQLLDQMIQVLQSQQNGQPGSQVNYPTPTSSLKRTRIGIVSGHWKHDSGAVCSDGLTEMDVNLRIATMVRQDLVDAGYDVDLLAEFDDRLAQYEAAALVSIHNDSCNYINNEATGFKVSAAKSTLHPEKANRLTECLVQRYQNTTGLPFDYNKITVDMSSYHAFDEINSNTPAAIIETGYLNLDRDILTNHPDIVALGVAKGILCYIRNEPISQATVTPTIYETQKP